MRAPFDIAADLDTPVSAYRKLAPFRPCFLLESVEGGARLARYSFLGLDPAFTLRVDAAANGRPATVTRSGVTRPGPSTLAEFFALLREARDAAPIAPAPPLATPAPPQAPAKPAAPAGK